MKILEEIKKEDINFFNSISLLNSLTKYQIILLIKNSSILEINPNSLIIKENEKFENIYLIEKGHVFITKSINNNNMNKNKFFNILSNFNFNKKKKDLNIVKIVKKSFFGSLNINQKLSYNIKSGKKKVILRIIPISFFLKKIEKGIINEIQKILQMKNYYYLNLLKKNIILKKENKNNYFIKSTTNKSKRYKSLIFLQAKSKDYLQMKSFFKRKNK